MTPWDGEGDEGVRLGTLEFLEIDVHHPEQMVILLMAAKQDPGTRGAVEKFGCVLTVAQATSLTTQLREAIQRLNG